MSELRWYHWIIVISAGIYGMFAGSPSGGEGTIGGFIGAGLLAFLLLRLFIGSRSENADESNNNTGQSTWWEEDGVRICATYLFTMATILAISTFALVALGEINLSKGLGYWYLFILLLGVPYIMIRHHDEDCTTVPYSSYVESLFGRYVN